MAPRILIVDDDFDIRDALAQILVEEGYEVQSAANGAEALDQLSVGPRPNVILLDLMMPVMSGWQFRAKQRADAVLADIPVVVITADAHVAERGGPLEVAGAVRKPIQLSELLTLIDRLARQPTT